MKEGGSDRPVGKRSRGRRAEREPTPEKPKFSLLSLVPPLEPEDVVWLLVLKRAHYDKEVIQALPRGKPMSASDSARVWDEAALYVASRNPNLLRRARSQARFVRRSRMSRASGQGEERAETPIVFPLPG